MLHLLLVPFLALATLFYSPVSTLERHIDRATTSIVRITGEKTFDTFFGEIHGTYVCSGFVIETHRILTAAHCVGEHMTVDGHGAVLIKSDEYLDLAVYETDTPKPVLPFREAPVVRFEDVNGVGYGFGFEKVLVTFNRVLLPDYTPELDMAPGIWYSNGFIGGMSGGPVIDQDGFVVGMVQRSADEGACYGVNVLTIHAFLLGTH